MKLLVTRTRHRGALVFALSWCWHSVTRYQIANHSHTLTIGLGLWSWHIALREA